MSPDHVYGVASTMIPGLLKKGDCSQELGIVHRSLTCWWG